MKEQFEIGQQIGEVFYLRESESPKRLRRCEFECGRCGKVFTADLADVKRKRIQSCGCYNLQRVKETATTHGQTRKGARTKEYSSWAAMISRCYNKKGKCYKDYGGRGITVCDRWRNSFENFFEDMGKCPMDKLSIDRIDNYAGYSPDNCRWATAEEQNRNKRSNHIIEYNGETRILTEWAEYLNVKYSVLNDRFLRGWTIEEMLTIPIARGHNIPLKVNQYTLDGEYLKTWESVKDICIAYKVDRSCISEACTGVIKTSRGFIWKYVENQ